MAKKFKKKSAAKPAPKSKPAKKAGSKPGAKAPAKPVKKTAGKPTARPGAKAPAKPVKSAAKAAPKPAAKTSRAASKPSKAAAKAPAKGPARKAKPAPKAARPARKPVQVEQELDEAAAAETLAEWRQEAPEAAEAPTADESFDAAPDDAGEEASGVEAEPAAPAEIVPLSAAEFAVEAARLLLDDKCTDIVVLDVAKLTSVSRFIVIGTGTSDRQMRSVLDDVADLGRNSGHTVARKSVDERATWVLADFVDVVVHLFEPNTRAYYDLEMMWGDAPRVAWERPAGDRPRNRNKRVVAE